MSTKRKPEKIEYNSTIAYVGYKKLFFSDCAIRTQNKQAKNFHTITAHTVHVALRCTLHMANPMEECTPQSASPSDEGGYGEDRKRRKIHVLSVCSINPFCAYAFWQIVNVEGPPCRRRNTCLNAATGMKESPHAHTWRFFQCVF